MKKYYLALVTVMMKFGLGPVIKTIFIRGKRNNFKPTSVNVSSNFVKCKMT